MVWPPTFAVAIPLPLLNGVGGHKAGLADRHVGTGEPEGSPTQARPLKMARKGMTDKKTAW